MIRHILLIALGVIALRGQLDPRLQAWNQPVAPYRVIGNIYYVGTSNISAHLITTREGHILIDSGFEETVPLIRAGVEKLGFRFNDVKILLSSHAHVDHVAGHALVKELTAARIMASEADAAVISSGDRQWKPAKVDRILADGDTVTLGGVTLTARLTPGHTKGCTTWTTSLIEDSTRYDIVFVGGVSLGGARLVDNPSYPNIAEDYARTFRVLRGLRCDIFLAQHPDIYRMADKQRRLAAGEKPNPFIDPDGYRAAIDNAERTFLEHLRKQQQARSTVLSHHYAEVNGVRLHYAKAGQGKLILFLHGFPEFWYAWKDQLREFGGEYLAVAPDLRGYNLSSKPAEVEQYRVPLLVEDVRALAEHLGHRKFILVGHDWGGAVAWAFALRHPDWLEKLVIINAPHPGVFQRELRDNPAQQKASQYMLMFRSEQAEQILSANNFAALEKAVLGELLQKGYATEEDRKAYLEAWSQPGALTGGLNYYRAARVGPPSGDASPAAGNFAPDPSSLTVRVSTLVIWGERDTALLTGNLVGLEQFVPSLQIRRIADGSHWVIHEQPALVNRYVRGFIQ